MGLVSARPYNYTLCKECLQYISELLEVTTGKLNALKLINSNEQKCVAFV